MPLSPAALGRLAKLRLRSRSVIEGLMSGMHRSPRRGQSIEFAEHKEYRPGDEIRHIDWKAFGRVDRYYIKRYEQETNLRAHLVIDGSASMAYGSRETKFERAGLLMAGLAAVLAGQQDMLGLGLWHEGTLSSWPARGALAHFHELQRRVESVRPAGSTSLRSLAWTLGEKLKRRSLVVLLSDLFDPDEQGLRQFLALRARGHDVSILHVLDSDELTFPFEDPTRFLAMEDSRDLEVDPSQLRRGYLAGFSRFLDRTQQLCREQRCDYHLAPSDRPPESILADWLATRARTAP